MGETTFGPEWLSFSSNSPSSSNSSNSSAFNSTPFLSSQEVEHRDGFSLSYQNSPRNSRHNLSPKSRVPLKFTRSKSTTQIFENAPEMDKNKNDVFAMLKERNSFDKNFPTLNSKSTSQKGPTTPINSTPPCGSPKERESAWSNHNSSASSAVTTPPSIPNTKLSSSSSSASSSSASSYSDDHSKSIDLVAEHLRGLVPPSSGGKAMLRNNRPEISVPAKKAGFFNPKPKAVGNFRKASSEPTLPLSPAYEEKYAKLLATKKLPVEKAKENMMKEGLEKAANQLALIAQQQNQNPGESSPTYGHASPKASDGSDTSRQDFFLGLLNAEKKKKSENENGYWEDSKNHTPMNEDDNNCKPLSSKVSSEEDEERFLRGLGWVPEEESHVPELTPEEISQIQNVPKSKTVAFSQNVVINNPSNVINSHSNEDKEWDELFGNNGELIESN